MEKTNKATFVIQKVQPGLPGLMNGSGNCWRWHGVLLGIYLGGIGS
jgi:hypothetical protein